LGKILLTFYQLGSNIGTYFHIIHILLILQGNVPILFTTMGITRGSIPILFTTLGMTWGKFPMLFPTLGITLGNIPMFFTDLESREDIFP